MRPLPYRFMLRIIILTVFTCCTMLLPTLNRQPLIAIVSPEIIWIKYLGKTSWSWAYSLQPVTGGGCTVTGSTSVPSKAASTYLAELNSKGELVWEKTFTVYPNSMGVSLLSLSQGGFIVGGGSGGQVNYQRGKFFINGGNMWAARTDDKGNITWANTYSAPGGNWGTTITSSDNTCFYLAGWQYSNRTPISASDTRIIKVTLNGEVLWDKTIKTEGNEFTYCAASQPNGFIYLCGEGGTNNNTAALLYKVSPHGTVEWQRQYPGQGIARTDSICCTSDKCIVLAGSTRTANSSCNHIYVLKVNNTGKVIWEKTIPLDGNSGANYITSTKDDEWIITGYTQDTVLNDYDLFAVKLDQQGKVIWQKIIALPFDQFGECIRQTTDGGYAICGYSARPFYPSTILIVKIK